MKRSFDKKICLQKLLVNLDFMSIMEASLTPILEQTSNTIDLGQTYPYDKFKFDLESLIQFIFPKSLQHPLAAGRLFVFATCGPLDENLCIRTGFQGKRILAEYELEQMCLQLEKEDIIQIYLHKPRDMGLLSSTEQEAIISQADAHLKRAKGKASLPRLFKKDIYELFRDVQRDEWGRISFHEAQNLILKFREDRIKEMKLVYPSIKTKPADKDIRTTTGSVLKLPTLLGAETMEDNDMLDQTNDSNNFDTTENRRKKKKNKRLARVGDSIAPVTMFQKMKGLTNPDIIDQTTNYLSKHAFKISDIDQKATSSVISNIKLLREVPPYCKNPYPAAGEHAREKWNDNSTMTGVGLGSLVQATASTSTWKRRVTSY